MQTLPANRDVAKRDALVEALAAARQRARDAVRPVDRRAALIQVAIAEHAVETIEARTVRS